jgi:hypothetical protein
MRLLPLFVQNCTEDELKQEITRLHEDKNKYEIAAKVSLTIVYFDNMSDHIFPTTGQFFWHRSFFTVQ